jgi:MFS transporter, DHA1 family, tetracycline resistance protein
MDAPADPTPRPGSGAAGSRNRSVVQPLPGSIRVLVTTSFVIALGYGIVAPTLPVFARTIDVGVTAISLLASAFATVRLVFGPISGRLVNRLGELRVFQCGLLIVAVSSGACAFVTTYWELLVVRAIGGAGSTLFTVSAASLLIRLAPSSLRGRATGAWATAFLLGTVAGPLLGGALVPLSPNSPFLAYTALLVLAVVISHDVLDRGADGRPGPPSAVDAVVTFPLAWGCSAFRAALTSNFVHGWIVYGVQVTLVPLYIVEVLAVSVSWSGAALAVSAAGTALTLSIGGRLAGGPQGDGPGRVGDHRCRHARIGPHCSATCVPGGMSLLTGVGIGLTYPATNATVGDVLTEGSPAVNHGTALAGFQMVGDLGAVVGPVLVGLVTDAASYKAAFALTGAIAAGSLVCWLLAPETRPPASLTSA